MYCKKEKIRKWKIPFIVGYDKCFEDLCLVSYFILFFSYVKDDLTSFFFLLSPFAFAEISKLVEAKEVNQFGKCITCKC